MEKQKKSHGKTIIIIILVLVVLGLVGYITYDKIAENSKDNNLETETKQTENKQDVINMLPEEEALKLGKEKYEYVRDGLYVCGYNQVKTDQNVMINSVLENIPKYKIVNIDEIKSNLTTHAFSDWYFYNNVEKQHDIYYMNTDCGGSATFAKDNYVLSVSKIDNNKIIYKVTEYFYTVSNDGIIINDINKAEKFENYFSIVKENNIWKINEYTDYYLKYII